MEFKLEKKASSRVFCVACAVDKCLEEAKVCEVDLHYLGTFDAGSVL